MLRRCDVAVLPEVGAINPVVDAEPWIRDAILSIYFGKSSVKDLPNIGFAVPVRIFHEENIGRTRDNQTSLPGHQAAYIKNVLGEDSSAVDFAVAIGIFQEPDSRTGRFSLRRIRRVVEHFGNVNTAVFIEDHFNGTHDLRFMHEQLDVEIIADAEAFQLCLGRQRAGTCSPDATGQNQR